MRRRRLGFASDIAAILLLASTAVTSIPAEAGFAIYNPYAPDQNNVDRIKINRLIVFGDSYSDPAFGNYDNWAEELLKKGTTTYLSDFAKSGATAYDGSISGSSINSLRQQLDRLDAAKLSLRTADLTIVYIGHNDINRLSDLTASKAHYKAAIDRLIAKGATSNNRRMLVALQHDINRDPSHSTRAVKNVPSWNGFVASLANARSRVIAVDLYTAFNRIYANPGRYGLVNVTTANATRSATDYLYYDGRHFGAKGHTLIRQVFRHYLSRGWDWANSLATGSATVTRLNQDITNGLVFRDPALVDPAMPGLGVVALGAAAQALAETPSDEAPALPSRAAAQGPAADGALAVTQRLGEATSLALVLGRYGESEASATAFGGVRHDTVSRMSGLVLQHRIGGWELATSLLHADHQSRRRDYDALVDASVDARFAGRSLRLGQRVGYRAEGLGATWQPWLELSYSRHTTESFTIADAFVSDVTYAAAPVGETMLGLGLAAEGQPIDIDGLGALRLHAGVAYSHSLAQDDYRVSIREAALPGYRQEEQIERPAVRRLGLDLGAVWEMTPTLALRADYAVGASLDGAASSEQRLSLGLSWRF